MARARNGHEVLAARAGFTLLELVVVVAIVATLAAVAVPRFADAAQRYRVELAADVLARDVAWSFDHARATGRSHELTVAGDAALSVTAMDDGGRMAMVRSIDLATAPHHVARVEMRLADDQKSLLIDGRGESTASGLIRLQAGSHTSYVVLDATSSKASAADAEAALIEVDLLGIASVTVDLF